MKNIIVAHQETFGTLWIIGWLFSIGYFRFSFWKGVLALIIWPYYFGVKFSKEPETKKDSAK